MSALLFTWSWEYLQNALCMYLSVIYPSALPSIWKEDQMPRSRGLSNIEMNENADSIYFSDVLLQLKKHKTILPCHPNYNWVLNWVCTVSGDCYRQLGLCSWNNKKLKTALWKQSVPYGLSIFQGDCWEVQLVPWTLDHALYFLDVVYAFSLTT